MRDVFVAGTGIVPFARRTDLPFADLARPAIRAALREADLQPSGIQAAVVGTVFGGMLAGQRLLKGVGISGIPVLNVENACSSGSAALHHGWLSIGAGLYDAVLVVGVEQLSALGGGPIPLERSDPEVAGGAVMPAVYAMRAQRYLTEHAGTEEDLARVVVKSRAHAARSPHAQMREPVTIEQVLASRSVASPLTLLQCCPSGDGAAALVLTSDPASGIRVLASQLTSGRFMAGGREMTVSETTERAAGAAYEQAGVGPEDLDVAEVHDAFSIAELMYYEALGLCARGDAPRLLRDGDTSVGGRIPVNPGGGLLSRGHPLGATGTAQAVEVVRQLRERADGRQVEGARVGLTHTTGGGISGVDHGACSVHVFAR